MRVVLRGGYNKYEEKSLKNSFWYEYSDFVSDLVQQGKKVALVTLAKPDGEYDHFVEEKFDKVEIIDSKSVNVSWGEYDAIFFPGGDSLKLYNGLQNLDFSLKDVKSDVFILGDSAGAYVLSSHFFHSPPGEQRGKIIDFYEGLNPEAKVITIAHKNNPRFYNELLLNKVNTFAKEKGISMLILEENEEHVLP